MCGGSDFILNNRNYSISIGYNGGRLDIWNDNSMLEYEDEDDIENRNKMKDFLKSLSSEELAEIILNIIDHGEED